MSDNNKTEEFLQKLAPCIERGELEKCVEEAARVAREFGNPFAHETLGNIHADEEDFEDAIKEYDKALRNSASMVDFAISEIHNNLGWVHTKIDQYNKAEEEFKKAKNLDPMNVKAIRNLRMVRKAKDGSEFCVIKKCLTLKLLILLFTGSSYYLFLKNRVSEAVFTVQITFFTALLFLISFYPLIKRFKIGTTGIEFEKSPSRFIEAKSQPDLER